MSTNRPFIVNPVQTAIAIGFMNPDVVLIADRVLPRVTVGGESFKWLEYPFEQAMTLPETFVGRRGRVNQMEFGSIERTATVDDHALDAPIPVTDIQAAEAQRLAGLSGYDPESTHTMMLTQILLNRREVRVASLMQSTATYAAAQRVTLSGTSQFSDYVNSDPIGVIKAGLRAMLMRGNVIVMGRDAWDVVSSHPHIVNAIKGNSTGRGSVTKEQFAALFEVREVIVGDGFVNVARPGQPANFQRIWGKDIILMYQDRLASNQIGMTFGYTAQFGARVAGSYDDPTVGISGADVKRVGERIKEIVAAQQAGYLIKNAVA